MKPQRDIFVMHIRPEPPGLDRDGRDPMYRMKGFLKVMLRRFGWRCLSVRPKSPDERHDKQRAGQAGTPHSARLTSGDDKGTGLPLV